MEPMGDLHRVRDVSHFNFSESFPQVKEAIESATFIAFDAEFTGIYDAVANAKQNSLFDTPRERYTTLRNNVKGFVISQFGLTTFQFDREANRYLATTFVFYLFPRSVGSFYRKFNAESSAFNFLSQYGFDFGKFMGSGVTYLSASDMGYISAERPWLASAIKSHRNGVKGCPSTALKRSEHTQLEDEVARLANWLADRQNEAVPLAEQDDTLAGTLCTDNPRLIDKLGHVLRKAFPCILVSTSFDSAKGKWSNVYQDIGQAAYRERLANDKAGFSRVFQLLAELKKPIVGHNPILDLMLMYNQFHAPLPADYATFKTEIHTLFPEIFDTKFLSYELRDSLRRDAIWDSNDLAMLYEYFESGVGSYLVKYSPQVHLAPGSTPDTKTGLAFHEAGWDSYCTGYCFVRIMHYFATQNNRGCGMDAKPLTSTQHLFSVNHMKNRINVSRANINNINLAGPDPCSNKPQWLVVELTDRSALRSSNITELVITHTDIPLDIKQISHCQALIAVNSVSAARELRHAFAEKKEFHVSAYNPFKHNNVVRCILWAGIISSGSMVATLLVLGKRL